MCVKSAMLIFFGFGFSIASSSLAQAPFIYPNTTPCMEKYAPKLRKGVPVTRDEALLVVAVQGACPIFENPRSDKERKGALCVLDGLYPGIDYRSYWNLGKRCYGADSIPPDHGLMTCIMDRVYRSEPVNRRKVPKVYEECRYIVFGR